MPPGYMSDTKANNVNSNMYRVSVSYHTTAEGGPENGYGDTYHAHKDCYVEYNEDEDIMVEDAIDCAADLPDPLPEIDGYEYEVDGEYADAEVDHEEKTINVEFQVTYMYTDYNNNNNQHGGKRRAARKSRKTRKTRKIRKSRKASRKASRKNRKASRKASRKNRKNRK